MAKKKTKPTRPKPRPRPGYRVYFPWLLLLALIAGCSDRPREVKTVADVAGDIDGDGFVDEVLEADENHVIWASGDRVNVATRPGWSMDMLSAPDESREEVDIDGDGIMDAWLTAEVARTPDGDYPELAGVDLSDVKADALASASEQAETQACIPWGSGCSTGGCCAPFSCMWTGVGINRKKKCCSGTSGSPFYNCQ